MLIKFLDGSEREVAYLSGAYLSGANLFGASLRRANLYRANLRGANLSGANLSGADLVGADLHGANLYGADLYGANLYGADLYGANLRGANLRGANLSVANLSGADLVGAYLSGAYLSGANLPAFQIAPEKGCFRAFKSVRTPTGRAVIEIEVSAKAQRTSSLVGRKCRCSKARVVSGIPAGIEAWSSHDPSFKYVLGGEVSVSDFDPDIRIECTRGIHFFMTRKEAEEY